MYKHRLQRLDPSVRSLIRDSIYSVLKAYASGGNHGDHKGPLHITYLFLKAADVLADKGIIEKPTGQKFTGLRHEGYPSVSFPNYDIDSDIANLMRQTFWELYLQGVLAPVTNSRVIVDNYNNDTGLRVSGSFFLDLDYVMLTPYGVDLLIDSGNRVQVHDPDGYLANFWGASPPPDQEMMRYLSECISVFRSGHLFASVILLGVASERLIDVLAENLRDALGSPQGDKWFNSKYKNKRDISARFRAVEGKLMGEYGNELGQEKLKDAFQGIVTLTFEQIRHARNDIAHPKGHEFTWNEVSGFLHNFVQYFRYVNKINLFLTGKP